MSQFPDCPEALHDTIIEWCFCILPALLTDDDLTDELIYFAHCIYQGAVNEERQRRWQQLTKHSSQ